MDETASEIAIGGFRFDPRESELRDPSGAPVALRPQTAQVLSVLAAHAGKVVSKESLMETVWADTHVTDDSLVQCISEIRRALGPKSGQLKTVPRRGYRLDADGAETAAAPPRPARRIGLAAVALALLIAGLAAWFLRPAAPAGEPQRIAVLPFTNASGDPGQDYFSNGLAEDLIVDLSGLTDVDVISRAASFALGSGAGSVPEMAALLRADVMVEGSVRRQDESLRISVALIDGETGLNLWARRFEGAPEDIFAFQDEVAEEIVRALSVKLSRAERARLGVRGTDSIEAHDAFLRGRALENVYTRETNLAAEAALEEALRITPDYALAHAHLAQVLSFRLENNWTDAREETRDAAFAHAERAVEIDPDLPYAHFSLGRLHTRSYAPPDEAKAIAAYEEALRLDPTYDDANMFLANIHIFNGRAEEALPLIEAGFAANPLPPFWYDQAAGMAHYYLGNYEAAEAHLVAARDRNPTAPYPYRVLIATYGMLGDAGEAEWTTMEYEALGREATVEALLSSASVQDDAYREALAEGYRRAGLPEN